MASRTSRSVPSLKRVAATTAGPSSPPSGCVMTLTFWTLMLPTEVAALSGLILSVSALLPAAQADRETIANAVAVAARAPCRRLRLTAAATP